MPTADQAYVWNLVAKKLAGEASEEELRTLEQLLNHNPALHHPVETITHLWLHSNPQAHRLAEQAFFRHLERMHDLKIDFDDDCLEPNEPL